MLPHPPRAYVWTKADTYSTALVAFLAFFTRFVGLSTITDAHTPVFDEKHYVPQAWDMVRSWMNPILGGIESNPGYGLVVHPPLAKQIEAYGEFLFGYTPLGWRVMTALFGVGTVMLTMALARRISHSSAVATFAGILALFDGVLLVSSRYGMLDIFQVFFIVAAAWACARDREQMRLRMHNLYENFQNTKAFTTSLGPRLGFRWWRFTMGVFLGLALSVKWSGLYYIAFFGLLTVALDAHLRMQYQVQRPILGALIRDSISAFASIVILPIALYAWSWRGWFASETAVYRHAATDGTIPADSWLNSLPDTLASWFYYHSSVLEFHASLTSSGGHSHPWDSKPWAWLVAARPVLYYSANDVECAAGKCHQAVYLFGTPVIWWLTIPVLLWALWSLVIARDFRYMIPFISFLAGFVPWLITFDRQMYFFYATALIPFSIVMISLALGSIARTGATLSKRYQALSKVGITTRGHAIVACYLVLVVAMFCYFSPLFYGYTIPNEFYNGLMWFNSWR
ncbi:dolichyl-phosphate-mannose--protein mannosyltransferase [Corynebacterium sp. sy039]|uniref:dolichyl-phosphate-mannose--protein mannosyltransferase n=1 Tax=Corynebacterium sp. sy039 TaxID=2599641 RepID=UPI0011B4777B|nr:phospholipid carrier-dependent glycosyltransferase [Corynebacterium sp. sy039]QDZ43493.1 phospholipid carrier-dependent glycosyltransferase [Corynebacterium sp. sy039]